MRPLADARMRVLVVMVFLIVQSGRLEVREARLVSLDELGLAVFGLIQPWLVQETIGVALDCAFRPL